MTKQSPFMESIQTPWFGVTMGLLGIIVGYAISLNVNGQPAQLPSAPAPAPTPTAAAPTPSAPAPMPDAGEVDPVTDDDYIYGNPDAEITLIEWSDAECPFCKRHHATPKQIVDQYDGKVNWVYRHYPLGFHPNAQKTAEGQECAGELGGNDAFWDYTDIVFEKGAVAANLTAYAVELGLDEADFEECLNSDRYAQKVKDQMASGSKAGVQGTPGNVLLHNETGEAKLVSGARPVSAFTVVIDEMLQ